MDSLEKRKQNLKHNRPSAGAPLVTDQSGLKVLFVGLILSLLFSFILKGLTHPGRIQSLIDRAIAKLPSQIKVTNEESHLSFSDGMLPRFAVVIKNIHLQSDNPCWMSPNIFIDELTLPVHFSSLFFGNVEFQKIVAQQVDIEFQKELSDCRENKTPNEENLKLNQNGNSKSTAPAVVLKPLVPASAEVKEVSLPTKDIFIHKMSVKTSGHNSVEFHMSDFELTSSEKSFHRFEIKAKTQMMKDESVGDYLSHSNISIEYKDFPYQEIVGHFFGHWREGYYSLATLIRPEENNFTLSSEIKHIPLSLVLMQLSKLGFTHKNFNGKEVWVSMQTEAQGSVSNYKEAHGAIKNFIIEGPVGNFSFDELNFQHLNPFKYDPFQIQINKLDLSKLLKLLNQPTSSMLGHLGDFTGVADWRGDHDIRLDGVLNNVDFIFGNKGRREVQKINDIETKVVYQDKNWNFDFSKLNFQGGSFLGDLQLKSDQYFKNINLKFRGEDVKFSPQVENLLTQSGEITPFQVQADFLIEQGNVKAINGFIKGDSVLIESTQINQWKFNLETLNKTNEFSGKMSFDSLISYKNSALIETLDPILKSSGATILDDKMQLEISKFNLLLKSKNLKDLTWKMQSAVLKTGETALQSEGGWTTEGQVFGQFVLKTTKESKRWILSGDRKNFQFQKD